MGGSKRPQSLVQAAVTTYGTNLAVVVLSLLNVLIVARTLGPAGRGDVAFLIAIGILSAHLATMSVQEANSNLAGAEPGTRRALATNSVVFAAAFGLGAAGLVALAVELFPSVGGHADPVLLWVAFAAIPVMVLKAYLSFLLQADYGFAVTNMAWLVGPLTTFIANAVLALAGALSVGTAIVAWLGGQVLGAFLLVAYVRLHDGFGAPDRRLAGRMLSFGAKSHVGRFMEVGNYRVDQWFLGAIAGSRELGLYSIAVAWAEVLFYLPGILVLVQRPDLVRARPDEAVRLAARVVRAALLLAAGLVVVIVLAAPILCVTVFGDAFAGSVDDLRVLALGAFGIVALELLRNTLTAQRRPILASSAIAVAFTLTIALDLLLIPSLGGLGAAIATTAAYSVGGIAAALIFTRALRGRLADLVPRAADAVWMWQRLRRVALTARPVARRGSG
jgi:O-antigen/teichoic acid export membrane protein